LATTGCRLSSLAVDLNLLFPFDLPGQIVDVGHELLEVLGREMICDLWGIHITGVANSSPQVVRWKALQARRVSARLWWRRRRSSRPLGSDEALATYWGVGDGEFEEAVEHNPTTARTAAVEAEHELIEVAGQMRTIDRSLVCSQEPPLGQRSPPAALDGDQLDLPAALRMKRMGDRHSVNE
jgi:hypothetical protein